MTYYLKLLFRKHVFSFKETRIEKMCESFLHFTIGSLSETLPVAVFVVSSHLVSETNAINLFLALIIGFVCSYLMYICLWEYKLFSRCQTSIIYVSYQISGELPSFIIGWSLLLYQSSAAASCARMISVAVNCSSNNRIQKLMLRIFGSNLFTKEPPDFIGLFAFLLTFLMFMAIERSRCNKSLRISILFFTICVVIFFTIVGVLNSNKANKLSINWEIIPAQILRNAPIGSTIYFSSFFMNYGLHSSLKKKVILPVISLSYLIASLITCGCIIFVLHLITFGRSFVPGTILFDVFQKPDYDWARYATSASISLCLCLALLDICQMVCATVRDMANEGLLFRFLNNSSSSKIRWKYCLFVVFLISLEILLVPVLQLMESMATSFITLCSVLLLCVLHRRYQIRKNVCQYQEVMIKDSNKQETQSNVKASQSESLHNISQEDSDDSSDTDIDDIVNEYKEKMRVATVATLDAQTAIQEPSKRSEKIVIVCSILLCFSILPLKTLFTSDFWYFQLIGGLLLFLGVILTIIIYCQPQTCLDKENYRVSFLPFVVGLALSLHLTLLGIIVIKNWICSTIWMISGMTIYICYGIRHSSAAYEVSASTKSECLTSRKSYKTQLQLE